MTDKETAIQEQERILVVDDEASIRRILETRLKMVGYEVITAADGEEALEAFQKHNPDLIILDVMMPKINGYKISRLLKYDNKYKDIPIIMVTARSQLEDKAIGEETGVNEYITKPFELDQIVKKVEEYIGASES